MRGCLRGCQPLAIHNAGEIYDFSDNYHLMMTVGHTCGDRINLLPTLRFYGPSAQRNPRSWRKSQQQPSKKFSGVPFPISKVYQTGVAAPSSLKMAVRNLDAD
jgi:hypothetical protein